MSEALTSPDALPEPSDANQDEALDEALASLPAPPRARARVLGVMLSLISVVSVALAWQLRDDVQYALSGSQVMDLGEGTTTTPLQAHSNHTVHLRASPQMSGAVHYSRPFFPGQFTVFPVAGRNGEAIYVQVDGNAATPGDFTGRLIPFDGAGGRYSQVGDYLQKTMNPTVRGRSWLLVQGVSPRELLWAPLLASFLLALAASDGMLLARLLRPFKTRSAR